MRAKRMIYWTIAVPVIVILLMILIVRLDGSDNCISRAMASKAMALAFTDKDSCRERQKNQGSRFPAEERDEWYAKYMDYLASEGYLAEASFDSGFAQDALTYGEAAFAAEKLAPGLSKAIGVSRKKYDKPMPPEEWWLFYESFLREADGEKQVGERTAVLFGTPDNIPGAAAFTAYTDRGTLGFEGIALDAYIDREIRVLTRGDEVIRFLGEESDRIVYENVWITCGENGQAVVYLGNASREFPEIPGLSDRPDGVLADIKLEKGRVRKVTFKEELIEGRVLAVRDDSIELEGLGRIRMAPGFRVYKIYGSVREQSVKDILVGDETCSFVASGNRICAALLGEEPEIRRIRVLITDSSFESRYHQEVKIRGSGVLRLTCGGKTEYLEPEKELRLTAEDHRFEEGRITVSADASGGEIYLPGIRREQGIPSCSGRIEVSREPEGLLVINELDVEDYLTRVVPSEMPSSYEPEALKAQAVCARTYACLQMRAGALQELGAHVDDTTSFQVYNNLGASEEAVRAVAETEGELVLYEGKPVETFYFSTSCGVTTDGGIWGGDPGMTPYLRGVSLTEGKKLPDLTSEQSFHQFLEREEPENYDSGYAMYRWETLLNADLLEKRYPELGTVQSVKVTERGTGGIAKTAEIAGSEGTKTVRGQYEIRKALGFPELEIRRKDGTVMTGQKLLPSAFLEVTSSGGENEKSRSFAIRGGGYGHGAGMSQNGAQAMAKAGKNYQEILKYFYSGIEVKEYQSSSLRQR